MFINSNKNIKRSSNRLRVIGGFSLIELLVTMGIAAIFGEIVIKSYSVSSKLAANIGISSGFDSTISSIQIYLKKEIIGAGSGIADPGNGLPKYFGIRSVNNVKDCSNSPTANFVKNVICGSSANLPKILGGSDLIAINGALPFGLFGQFGASSSGVNDNLHYAVNVVGASSNKVQTEIPNPFFDNTSLYSNSLFIVYSLINRSQVFIGQITGFTNPDKINYSQIGNYIIGDNISSLSTLTSDPNVRMALFFGTVIYLSANNDLIALTLNPGSSDSVIYRNAKIIATGVDDFQLKYGVTSGSGITWVDSLDPAPAHASYTNSITKLKVIKVGLVISNHMYKVCRNIENKDKPAITLFGHISHPLANKNTVNLIKDPCKYRVISFTVSPYNYLYDNNN